MSVHLRDAEGNYMGCYDIDPNVEGWTVCNEPVERAIARLNRDFNAAMTVLQGNWPDYEIQTWTVQASEAKRWWAANEGDKPSTPFLTQLYQDRVALGWIEEFADLIDRVMANDRLYTQATAGLIAVRHVAERKLNQAADPSLVEWSFT